jgi:anti-sigma B factor antagonist
VGPAAFEVERLAEHIQLVAVSGELDLSNSAELRRRADSAVRSGGGAVVIDLSRVTHMDSTGLASLIEAHQLARGMQARLALVIGSEPVRRTVEVRGLDRLFTIFATRDEALAALHAG